MSAAHAILYERCPECSRFRPPGDMMGFGANVRRCRHCQEKHVNNLVIYSNQPPPKECPDCHRNFDDLADAAGNVVTAFVPKDGVYQPLCLPCADRYLPKRADLFKGTAFGRKVLNL